MTRNLERYHRQMLLPSIGEAGQRRLAETHVLLVGCGALGCVVADALVRAGVGTLSIVDRDIVELTNLQRQSLYDERDAAAGTPKAEAARTRLSAVNSAVKINANVDDFNARTAVRYARSADIFVDGLDNFETRYLLNDLAVRWGRPYVYGGAVATNGMAMTILPHPAHRDANERGRVTWSADDATPCLRCLFPAAPPPGSTPTCDTAGVLGPVVTTVAAHQAAETIKIAVGAIDAVERRLLTIDLWSNERRTMDVSAARADACPCCGQGTFVHLDGDVASATTTMCGRNAVQINPSRTDYTLDLAETARRLAPHGDFAVSSHLIRGALSRERADDGTPIELTLFANGRAIVKGTTEPDVARSLYAKYVGA